MGKRYTEAEAKDIMVLAGFLPLVPFVSSSNPWLSLCKTCNREVSPTLNNVKSKGVKCMYCSGNAVHIDDVMKVMQDSNLKPLVPFPGAKKAWNCECLVCGNQTSPTFSAVKSGGSCKYCARKKVGDKIRTPQSDAIKLMRKAGLEPTESFKGSGSPWRCRCMKCNKLISVRLSSVKSRKTGCPYCSETRVDSKDAEALFLAANLRPLTKYQGNKKPWRAIHIPCGREVSPTYLAIKRGQGPCKYCSHKSVHPEDAKSLFLANGLKPLEPYPGDNKKPWRAIHIPCGNEVNPNYNVIQRNESIGCHFCSDQFVDSDEAFKYFISKGYQPLVPYPGSSKPWKSIHEACGQVVQPRYGHIKSGRKGCPVCAGVVPITHERAFKFFRDNGLEPQEDFRGPHKPWKSIHVQCGREVAPRWASIQQGNSGCVYCSGKKVDLKDARALLRKLELKPLEPFPGGSIPWKCIHLKCGTEVSPTYSALRSGQGPCLVCGKNMVTKEQALSLLRKNSYRALVDFPGGSKPWLCVHETCGSRVNVIATYLRGGGKGCAYCAGTKAITAGQAVKEFKSRGYRPTEPFINARTPIKAIHAVCGKEVKVSWSLIRSGGNCRYCAGWRNLLAPAYFYLITSNDLGAHKVGVSSFDASDNRIDRHVKNGWQKYAILEIETGEQAYELEARVLDWLRSDLQLPHYLVPELMPQGGYTETVNADEISLAAIWAKVQELNS